jgi:threonine 3-dehydrogenase
MGATLVVDPRERSPKDAQRELGMVEGFDVVFEMSGNAGALRDALANMAHGAGMAILGIPTEEIAIDVGHVVFDQLRLHGIYGREMYETWYKMSVMLKSGLDISPVITHRFDYRDHEAAFTAARTGSSGKVVMDWTS